MDFCDDDPFATSDDETSKVDNDLSGKEDEDEDDDFSDIAPYFTPKKFKELSSPEKRSYQNQKLRYENCRMRGIVDKSPYAVNCSICPLFYCTLSSHF